MGNTRNKLSTPEGVRLLKGKAAELAPPHRPATALQETPEPAAVLPPLMASLSDPSTSPPLSFAQERFHFLHSLHGELPLYHTPVCLRLLGALRTEILQKSLDALVTRHESLRFCFQPPSAPACLPLDILKAEGMDDQTLTLLLTNEAAKPFDLAHGPLIRATLFSLAQAEHVLLLTGHHAILDDYSAALLLQELGIFYQAFSEGSSAPLPCLKLRYADYAVWQRAWMEEGSFLKPRLAFWKKYLAGAPAALALPTDRPRPLMPSFQGASFSFDLEPSLAARARHLAEQENVSLFAALTAAFQTVLARWSCQEEVVVGYPVEGRTLETEKLVGSFTNMLPLCTDLTGKPSFRHLLHRVQDGLLETQEHQEVPFETIVEVSQSSRDLSRNPLFQVMLDHQKTTLSTVGDLRAALRPVELKVSPFDLSLTFREDEESLSGNITFATDLFDLSTIERLAGHFKEILRQATAAPDVPVTRFSLLTAEEQHQILTVWNETAAPVPHRFVHTQIAEQAARTPNAIAVVLEDQRLTYAEMDARANKLAALLRQEGVGPESFVGICLERSLDMIVGVLGILKAGGAYVPLDADHPKERLDFMLQDTGIDILVTQTALLEKFPHYRGRSVCFDRDREKIEAQAGTLPDVALDARNIAYVIYTSGSTGKPKGVLVEHRSFIACIEARTLFYASPAPFVLFPPLTFDSSVAVIFGTLVKGATLVLTTKTTLQDPKLLSLEIQKQKGGNLLCVPSLYAALMDHWSQAQAPDLLQVIVAGEACSDKLIARSGKMLPKAKLYNEYGPTEATVWATVKICENLIEGAPIPIGRPIANTKIFLLDPELNPVPVGIMGELYIGGAGITRGYLNRPSLTAEKFVPNPFGKGDRLYRTGDLARYLPNGDIEFLGRIDHQVKIRGFRIELGEIESVLREQPGVHEVAVLAKGDTPSDQRLMAYLVPSQGAALDPDVLRQSLRERLPDYMIPAAFITLKALPLTPNGKLDRKALPSSSETGSSAYLAPRTKLETTLAEVWKDVLGVDKISIDKNFFDVGGNSLRVVKMRNLLVERGIDVSDLMVFFKYTTIITMAEFLEGGAKKDQAAPVCEAVGTARRAQNLQQMRRRRASGSTD